ncbi:hypothetical protein SAMN02745866_04041 [Alteromonadaceae bacterium Bs31]|nr:hypothetical protein SAMN02745866_04041 [Alteromonadaceae bacterium Bs31]
MKEVKSTAEYTIFQRNDERYAVRGKKRQWINGEAKIAILEAEGLRKKPEPKPAEPEEAPAEEAAAEGEKGAE